MLTPAQLAAYLDRVGHSGPVAADEATLVAIHHAHVTTIPYENLDIQLGRPLSLAPEALVAKLVTARRGGFCYEQNGLLALALRTIGFEVTMVAGAVERAVRGDDAWSNHMPLLADVDGRRWLVDVGLGDGFLDPLPLEEGEHADGLWKHSLTRIEGGLWRCFPDPRGSVPSFDFGEEPCELADFAGACVRQSTSPDSSFVKTLVVQRPLDHAKTTIRGAAYAESGPDGKTGPELLATAGEWALTLSRRFGLDLPASEVEVLYPKAREQYERWRAEKAIVAVEGP
ncbi:arylamine N-acetyltransferase [Actinorhabdospora filicis]|uniref:Arylamine N-acetyltransferase n=1 Tax=Actinorhabdospora filicis TaxID=1785913 RepID=A0A9W6STS9_9ACTN|nr:arylamine N-acetyltransferase [Actinorhabdospora filicis]GLZ80606.1 arylamine N-acetyltransferase [Actinorhabdospora filicis]